MNIELMRGSRQQKPGYIVILMNFGRLVTHDWYPTLPEAVDRIEELMKEIEADERTQAQ